VAAIDAKTHLRNMRKSCLEELIKPETGYKTV